MDRQSLLRWLVFVTCLGVMLTSCRRSGEVLARLLTREGAVEADLTRDSNWRDAKIGTEFGAGHAVRTATNARSELQLSDGSFVRLKENTLLRFLERPPGTDTARLDLALGEAEIQAGTKALRLETKFGAIVIAEHGRLQLQHTALGTRVAVLVGTARIEARDGVTTLKPGESVDIDVGRAIVETAVSGAPVTTTSIDAAHHAPAAVAPDAAIPDAATAAAIPDAATAAADITEAYGTGPDHLDLIVAAGESFTVHDPRPPTALGFRDATCPGRILAELDRAKQKSTIGRGVVRVSAAVGAHKYRIVCVEDERVVASGVVVVMHDAGTRTLAKAAPPTQIDADGRRYTVLYQSRLPRIEVVWPSAPAGSYVLNARSSKGQKSYGISAPRHTFASGELAEGAHEIWFEGPNGQRSKTTAVSIRFDNAAPTASITSPEDGQVRPGESVTVAGTALPGWLVSVGGRALQQDDNNRFTGQASVAGDTRALAIQFVHPQRGIHYYLRRGAR